MHVMLMYSLGTMDPLTGYPWDHLTEVTAKGTSTVVF